MGIIDLNLEKVVDNNKNISLMLIDEDNLYYGTDNGQCYVIEKLQNKKLLYNFENVKISEEDCATNISKSFELSVNSASTCLQTPQGYTKEFKFSATTAHAIKSLYPSLTALVKATLSAHIVGEKQEFSTLHPEKISPSEVNIAEPTLKLL
ncbi:hypothetical protein NAPIS_ORF01102 [Vairimorpha apis BRL 01]|uniref:Uncharacterized protein n=1 Tax=Vairimorpha apis BRL 01 TaxID=1037528 RepID=T0LA43_9MICR|nr:hypothetical protein NAPIS_ORF01102 [Vairimorpha apis BRL 01]